MKTRLLIICGIIVTVLVILLTYYGTSNTFDQEKWYEKRYLIMGSNGLHNLNPTDRDEFITKYTDMLNGEFHDHAYIIDLQNEYVVGEPITFTVATWGYGHPCQSPSFVYYYEIKDPENIVFEDQFIRWCQIVKESDYDNYYSELDSNLTEKSSDFDVFPVFDKPGSYIVSIDDKAEYEFEIIDDFDATFGGPGNRHPAFLGYYIPDICTNDMVKFLKKNSDMFDNNIPYSSPLDGDVLDPGVNPDDMIQCENELLENRDSEPSWPGR